MKLDRRFEVHRDGALVRVYKRPSGVDNILARYGELIDELEVRAVIAGSEVERGEKFSARAWLERGLGKEYARRMRSETMAQTRARQSLCE